MYSILIIEDDLKLQSLIKEHLIKYGFNAMVIDDFIDIENQFEKINPDLVLLDINIPYYDGFYLCRVFRRKSKIPVIIISARSGVMEQVMGIELGADDYITKPFSNQLLLAKINASLRRAYGEFSGEKGRTISISGLTLDDGNFKMSFMGKEAELTKNEFKLLRKLLDNADRIVTRGELLEEIWDENTFVGENTLTVNATRVKSKLGELGLRNVITTKRGVGYGFNVATVEAVSAAIILGKGETRD